MAVDRAASRSALAGRLCEIDDWANSKAAPRAWAGRATPADQLQLSLPPSRPGPGRQHCLHQTERWLHPRLALVREH